MNHRARSARARFLAALPALFLLFVSDPGRAELRVEAQLSPQELPAVQPVQLTLTVVASDESTPMPDLSVLEADFQVLDRRTERRASVTNGRRREELRLRLMLLPRRGGELELPAIPVGGERTTPLRLTVKGEPPPGDLSPSAGPGTPVPAGEPGALDHLMLPPPGPYGPDWGLGPLPDPAPSSVAPPLSAGEPGLEATPPRAPGPVPRTPPRASTEPAAEAAETFSNPWFWVSVALAVTLAGTIGWQRGRPGSSGAGPAAGSAAEPPPPDPLVEAAGSVRAAYQRGDGAGAREALLSWARLRWPADPPGNLSRLAGRVQPPLRDHITQLEKAFFSPDPIHWERDPVPDELLAESAARGQTAAGA
jgi:hypothetical protein